MQIQYPLISSSNEAHIFQNDDPDDDPQTEINEGEGTADDVEHYNDSSTSEVEVEVDEHHVIKRAAGWCKDLSRLSGKHTPHFNSAIEGRGTCKCCRRAKIQTKCLECDAFLCLNGIVGATCWCKHHHEA